MPRVSEEHLERRRRQILDAARLCFARKGFHDTSMQDVFAESGLSAGAVYRYFKSKDDIVAALATQTMVGLRATMLEAIRADTLPTPAELIGPIAEYIVERSGPEGPVRLAPQAWSLALVRPEATGYVRDAILALREVWHEYSERMRAVGWLPENADTEAVASALIGLLPGFILQHLIIGDPTPETLARGVRTLLPYGEDRA
ncbi:TetR/AcrR family transcriptional regulator [Nocardia bovistercoris]|uniref:TetR/AcrR family transcriptional regulator n=1 Tax=Nocardia bovistercoris TaxID=2785916 RepID=A0A931IAX8_9NOCA|nr:TetR/AcrR family transcriptional regulator [Nocardia bovistercoris]MBH0777256.1 TetR/AcrR family transcriptional regulator [Nocardia bovistercoris]